MIRNDTSWFFLSSSGPCNCTHSTQKFGWCTWHHCGQASLGYKAASNPSWAFSPSPLGSLAALQPCFLSALVPCLRGQQSPCLLHFFEAHPKCVLFSSKLLLNAWQRSAVTKSGCEISLGFYSVTAPFWVFRLQRNYFPPWPSTESSGLAFRVIRRRVLPWNGSFLFCWDIQRRPVCKCAYCVSFIYTQSLLVA